MITSNNNYEWLDIVMPKEKLIDDINKRFREDLHIKISNKTIKEKLINISSTLTHKRCKCVKKSIAHRSMITMIESAIINERESIYTTEMFNDSFRKEKQDFFTDLSVFLNNKKTISASEFWEIVSDSMLIYKNDNEYQKCCISRATTERMFKSIIEDFNLEIKHYKDEREKILPTSVVVMYLIPLYTDNEIKNHIAIDYPTLFKNPEKNPEK